MNAKTGPMWQAWLLHQHQSPFDAVRSGADAAICGGCARRGEGQTGTGRSCYVNLFTGPSGIFRAYQRGAYPRLSVRETAAALAGEQIRITAYGDPAAIPWAFWATALKRAAGWVGYTHLWRICDQRLRQFLMASVDDEDEQRAAAAMGWRTFRVREAHDPVRPWEFICPASSESGHRTTCQRCQLCRGLASPAKSVVIVSHGRRTAHGTRGKHNHLFEALIAGESVGVPKERRNVARIVLSLRQRLRRTGDTRQLRTSSVGDETMLRLESLP